MPSLPRTATAPVAESPASEAADEVAARQQPQVSDSTSTGALDDFEASLRSHDQIVERMEAVIRDPSTSVPSRHHRQPTSR